MTSKVLLVALAAGALAAAPRPAAAQAAAGSDFGQLFVLQSASDYANAALTQTVRAAVARGETERRSMSASEPIKRYLQDIERQNSRPAFAPGAEEGAAQPQYVSAADDPAPLNPADWEAWDKRQDELRAIEEANDAIVPLVESELRLWEQQQAARERIDAYVAAKAKGVEIKILTARSIEDWGRLVVIVPPGEVIENDPMDVAHARLEDLTRRREELQEELKTKPTSDAMRSILRDLASIDREINSVMFQITGVVWFDRGGKGSVCHPKAVKGRPVAWYNCDYWAEGVPFVVDPNGENIIVDRVRLEVDEGPRGFRKANIAYYTRPHGQPPADEPGRSVGADFRYLPDGTLQLVAKEFNDAGEERERVFPIEVSTDDGKGLIPGFSNHGPFKLKFRRDPKAYITFEQAQAIARGVTTMKGGAGAAQVNQPPATAPDDEDLALAPLVVPTPQQTSQPPPPQQPSADDEDLALAPLTQPTPPRPSPPPPPVAVDDIAPLTTPK